MAPVSGSGGMMKIAFITIWIAMAFFGIAPISAGFPMGTPPFHLQIRLFSRPPLNTFFPTSETFLKILLGARSGARVPTPAKGVFPKTVLSVRVLQGSVRAGIGSARAGIASVRVSPVSARAAQVSARIASGSGPIRKGWQGGKVAGRQGEGRFSDKSFTLIP